jgi:hypothetical protein
MLGGTTVCRSSSRKHAGEILHETSIPCGVLTLQRHLQNMLFYHKGLGVRKKLLPCVACARKAAILHVQIWSAHSSDVVGIRISFFDGPLRLSPTNLYGCQQVRRRR